MLTVTHKDLRLSPSYAALRELMQEGLDLYDVVKFLEHGYDAPRKRKKGVIEKWFNKGNKTYNVVIGKDYDKTLKEEVWVIIHVGKFGRRGK